MTQHEGVGYPVPETEYVIGRLKGEFLPPPLSGLPPMFRRTEPSSADKIFEEFSKELARALARAPFTYQTPVSGNFPQQAPFNPHIVGAGLFGIQAYICRNCYTMKPKIVSYVAGDKGGSIETPLACPGPRDDLLVNTKMSADEYIASRSRAFPDFLKSWLGSWAGNQLSLIAAEITTTAIKSRSTFTFVTEDGLTGQKKSVTLVYSDAKLIHVGRQNGWALRTIREGQTPISNEELMEFLGMLGDSTFGFFKVDTTTSNNSERLYLIAAARAAEPQKIRYQARDDMKGKNTSEAGSRRSEEAPKSRRENLFAPRASPPSPLPRVDEVQGVSPQIPEG